MTNVSIRNCTCHLNNVITYYFFLHVLALLDHHQVEFKTRGKMYKAPVCFIRRKCFTASISILQMHFGHKKMQKLFHLNKFCMYHTQKGIRITNGYRLDGLGIESRLGGEIFCTHPDWLWGHPASYTIGTGPLSWG